MIRCTNCGADILAVPRPDFYGLRKALCQECSATTVLPMSRRYRIAFFIVAVWMGAGITVRLLSGDLRLGLATVVLIVAMLALIKDWMIRRRIARNSETTGSAPRP